MNPLAEQLNETIKARNPSVFSMLSEKGKRIFYPTKGIIAQAAEAKEQADPNYNATIGIATDKNGPLGFNCIGKFFNDLSDNEIFNYSNSMGNPALRKAWEKHILEYNPLLKGKSFSSPVVCAGLTHAMHTVSELFVDKDEVILLPDQIWGNYRLMLSVKNEARLEHYPFFKDGEFNVDGLSSSIEKNAKAKKVTLLLNFPNNPTGYAPTEKEAEKITKMLISFAEKGIKLLVILDEAYFGLFFKDDIYRHSLFSILANAHENLLAIKICGATKEFFVWGFRIGFITLATKGATKEFLTAFEQKMGALVRASVSNCSTSAQNILRKVIEDDLYKSDFEKNYRILEGRVKKVQQVLQKKHYEEAFSHYPFNSGYFMLLKLKKVKAEDLRKKLLAQEKIGTIATAEYDLRIAFSCIEEDRIEDFFDRIYTTAKAMIG